jgi:hypothetical protein
MKDELRELGFPSELSMCFEVLPVEVSPSHADGQEKLFEGFRSQFRCLQARSRRGVVFLWTVDRPYRHDSGKALTSKISYIEKTDQTISQRWAKKHIVSLTTDQDEGEVKGDSNSLRTHAAANKNWTFYSRLIREHGPLQIWWAGSEHLNSVSSEKLRPREWERRLLALYWNYHGCWPLKNRKG